MERYRVTGMSCAACSARVEKAVRSVDGVTSCAVNLLTGSLAVEGDASACSVIAAVEQAGYGASQVTESPKRATVTDEETPRLLRRFVASMAVLIPLMYLSMGHVMW